MRPCPQLLCHYSYLLIALDGLLNGWLLLERGNACAEHYVDCWVAAGYHREINAKCVCQRSNDANAVQSFNRGPTTVVHQLIVYLLGLLPRYSHVKFFQVHRFVPLGFRGRKGLQKEGGHHERVVQHQLSPTYWNIRTPKRFHQNRVRF